MSLSDNTPLEILQLPMDQVDPDPDQLRKERNAPDDLRLLASIANKGQLVPIHVVPVGTRWKIIDGHGRHGCLKQLKASTIASIVLTNGLNETEVLIHSLMLNCTRSDIHYLDRSEAFKQLQEKYGWKQTKLAEQTGEDLSTVNKLLAIGRLDEPTKHMLRAQSVKFVKAYQLATSNELDREGQLKAISSGQTQATSSTAVSVKRVACPLASGITVTVQGPALTMEDFLFSLEYVLKESRKHKAKNIDVTTLGKLFHDQAKAGGKS